MKIIQRFIQASAVVLTATAGAAVSTPASACFVAPCPPHVFGLGPASSSAALQFGTQPNGWGIYTHNPRDPIVGIRPNRHTKISAPWLGLGCISWLDGRCGSFGINPMHSMGLPTNPVTGLPMWPPMLGFNPQYSFGFGPASLSVNRPVWMGPGPFGWGINPQLAFGIPGTPSCSINGGACWGLNAQRAAAAPLAYPGMGLYPVTVPIN